VIPDSIPRLANLILFLALEWKILEKWLPSIAPFLTVGATHDNFHLSHAAFSPFDRNIRLYTENCHESVLTKMINIFREENRIQFLVDLILNSSNLVLLDHFRALFPFYSSFTDAN
jgi:hypothetical protein